MTEPNNTFETATPLSDFYAEQPIFISDSVSNTDGDDYYRFYNLFGATQLYLSLYGLTADADLYVYDQNRNLVGSSTQSSNLSETINASLSPNQYYYIQVRSFNSATTNYTLGVYNDYAGSTLGTARDIGVSWGQDSSKFLAFNKVFWNEYLDFRDNTDLVKFRMETIGTISLRRLSPSGTLVSTMELLDATGNVLNTATGGFGGGLDLDRISLSTGDYYVRFRQTAGAGAYQFRIVSDYAGDTTATARELGDLFGTSRQFYDMVGSEFGTSYTDTQDLYKFTLSQTAPIELDLTILNNQQPPTFDANLRIARDSNGDGFISSSEVILASSLAGNDRLSATLAAGTYYAQVVSNGAYTSYQLNLNSDLDHNPSDPRYWENMSKARNLGALVGEIPINSINDGFGPSDFRDFFKFQMAAAGEFQAFIGVNDFFSRTDQAPSLFVVRDLNNNQRLDTGENITPFGTTGSLAVNLAAGTYYLATTGNGGQLAYNLRTVSDYAGDNLASARSLAAITGATPAIQTFRDFIEQPGHTLSDTNDFYRFTLGSSYEATIRTIGVVGEDLSLSLIRDVNGNNAIDAGDVLVTSNVLDSPNETINRLLNAGTYFIQVRGINGGTNYTLTTQFVGAVLDSDDTIAEVAALPANNKAVGQFADLAIENARDVDLVKFTVVAGQRVGLDLDSRLGSNLNTYLRLFRADGTALAANDNGVAPGEAASGFSYLTYTFAQAGTYYAGVSLSPNTSYSAVTGLGDANGAGAVGAYRLSLDNLGIFLTGTAGNDTLTGGVANDSLSGGAGNDFLNGAAGNDTLDGGTGNDVLLGGLGADRLTGGTGNDIYYVDAVGDLVIETSALVTEIDMVISTINYTLGSNVERLTLSGTAISGTGNSLNNILVGNGSNNVLSGGVGNDVLDGGAGNDTLDGGTGNDVLLGGLGVDRLTGGTGNDIYYVDAVGDLVIETSALVTEIDTVISTVSYALGSNVERLTLSGSAAINGTGNSLNNILVGNTGNNTLMGGAGNDYLDGGVGNDTLDGGLGADRLIGGVGTDIFVLHRAQGSDLIQDFSAAQGDRLRVSRSAAEFFSSGLVAGVALTAAQIRVGAGVTTANTAAQRFILNSTTGDLFFDSNGNAAGGNVLVARLQGVTTLAGTAFQVVA